MSDSRAKATEKAAGEEKAYDTALEKMGLGEKDEKPFWAKFLRSDYLQEDDDGPLLPKVLDVLEGNKEIDQVVN